MRLGQEYTLSLRGLVNSASRSKQSKFDMPGSEQLIRMLCRGSSMSPTLKLTDVLFVKPCGGGTIRCGDVVVFNRPGRSLPVVHRVVRQDVLGMRTRGDNNDSLDPDYLEECDITGLVLYRLRETGLDRVHGGRLGTLIGAMIRFRRDLEKRFSYIFRPVYHWLASSGILRRWPFHPLGTKVICFEKNGAHELRLLCGRRLMGEFVPELHAWRIDRPFRLFVDESSLPKPQPRIDRATEVT